MSKYTLTHVGIMLKEELFNFLFFLLKRIKKCNANGRKKMNKTLKALRIEPNPKKTKFAERLIGFGVKRKEKK